MSFHFVTVLCAFLEAKNQTTLMPGWISALSALDRVIACAHRTIECSRSLARFTLKFTVKS